MCFVPLGIIRSLIKYDISATGPGKEEGDGL